MLPTRRPTPAGPSAGPKVTDLVQAVALDRSVQLAQITALRAQLDEDDAQISDITKAALTETVGEYVLDGGENEAALAAILRSLSRPERYGGAFYLHGVASSGKSHLLGLVSLLAESQRARDAFAASHPHLAGLCDALASSEPLLVVMCDLGAHRGQQDQLEDVIFECTETELHRPKYATNIPLTELTHALQLIDRHLVPAHRDALDAAVAERVPGFESWEHLRAESPGGAARLARTIVGDVGLPLDFRQSRVERLATLLEAVRTLNLRGVLWLIDGLSAFMSGAGTKGMTGDWDFLHFLAQRAKITPLWTLIGLRHSPQMLAETHPYAVGEIERDAEGAFGLSNAHIRDVVARRVVRPVDSEAFDAEITATHAAHEKRMPAPPFGVDRLRGSYPLHPLTQQCVESVSTRLFSEIGSLGDFVHATIAGDATRGIRSGDTRPAGDLVSPAEAYDYLASQIANHTDVSVYAYDVVDFYARNSATIAPGQEDVCLAAAKSLTLCRLANLAPTVAELADALFPASDHPELPVSQLQDVLEQMRLKGRHIEVRKQPGEGTDLYRADARTTFADAARRRLAAMKATIDPEDPRLREYLHSVSSDAILPLGELAMGPLSQPVEWHNTTRYVSIEAANMAAMQAGALTDAATTLADPSSLEDCLIYVADPLRAAAQRERWLALAGALPNTRATAGLVAWVPRPLTDQELDTLKSGLACRTLLDEPSLSGTPDAQGLRMRLEEEEAAFAQEARATAVEAYYGGEVLNNRGVVMSAQELNPVRGDWGSTVAAMGASALSRLFPGFPPIAPTRRLEGQEQTDLLIDQFVLPAEAPVDEENPLNALIQSIAVPLGIAVQEDDRWELRADGAAVRGLMEYIERRDRPAGSQVFDCGDLALYMLKSEIGLPVELFEVAVAALVRTGFLAAVGEDGVPDPWRQIGLPIRQHVSRLMQAPLLEMGEWQQIGRLARAALGTAVVTPSRLTQEALWDQFLAARDAYGQRAAVVKSQLQGLSARLTQNGANWEETRQALATLDAFFAAFDDNLPAATGLKEVLGRTAAYMKTQGGRMKLRTLLEFAEDLEGFLKEPAQELIAIHEYLNDPSLSIDDHSELVRIRSRILTYLGSGEQLFRDRSALQRTAQAFMAAYRRSYLACHAAQYRASKFQAFSTFRESQEYLTLERLSRLAVEMDIDKPAVDTMLDDQIAQHCSGTGLAESLSDRPTCPRCGLRLDDEVRLLSIDQIREATLGAIRTYIQQLHSPEITATVQAYVESLGADSPVNHALNRVQTLSLKARPREVMSVFSEDVVAHLNRALGGQLVHSRRLDVLGAKLADRTLTRDEIARIVEAWLEGDDDVRPEDLVVVDI